MECEFPSSCMVHLRCREALHIPTRANSKGDDGLLAVETIVHFVFVDMRCLCRLPSSWVPLTYIFYVGVSSVVCVLRASQAHPSAETVMCLSWLHFHF